MTEPMPQRRSDADQIYDDFLRRRDAGEQLDFEALCGEHAALAPALRKREAARALLETLLPEPLAVAAQRPTERGTSGAPESGLDVAAPDLADPDAGSTHELLARLRAAGPRGARYQILGEVGRGGMGVVLRVVDTELRRKLAMKVARPPEPGGNQGTPVSETKLLDRFLQEAQITSQLDHPGIVPVYEIGIDHDGRAFFTMRYVRGQTLKEVFDLVQRGEQGWSQIRAVQVLLRVCETMSYAHDKQTIHRDLKPANVMVGRSGEVYVMDWGLARVLGRPDWQSEPPPASDGESRIDTWREEERDATPDSPRLTVDGEVLGTPAYMAPEQASGEHDKVGKGADVYALGAMLYHLISGEMPYVVAGERVSSRAVRLRVIAGPPRSLYEFGRRSPPALVAVCEKAMARKVEARYPDMQSLADDLRAYLEGRVVAAYETGSWAETKMWVRRNRALAGLLAGLLFVAVVAALVTRSRSLALWHTEQVRQALDSVTQFAVDTGDPDFGRKGNQPSLAWWLDHAQQLLAKRQLLQQTVERLRRGVTVTDQHRTQALAAYQRAEELDTKQGLLLWRRRMLGEEPWPTRSPALEVEVELLSQGDPTQALRQLNGGAFRRVRPDEPRILGEEVLAVAMAERAVNWPDAQLTIPTYRDTYAFALFRTGHLDQAVAQQRLAVAAQQARLERIRADPRASDADRETAEVDLADLDGNLNILQDFRDDWRNIQKQQQRTDELAADIAIMSSELTDAAYSLAMPSEALWHREVAMALRQLDRLQQQVALVRRATLEPPAAQAWQEASEAVRREPKYRGAITLTPQVGLLPIGADPQSRLWEFVHLASGEAPRRGADGRLQVRPESGIVFVLLPGGKVPQQTGMPHFPVHDVELTPFFLAKFELTQQQWSRLAGDWSRTFMVDSPTHWDVLNQVTWSRAMAILAGSGCWLCLPTGAQWEYGCRAETTTRWWSGDDPERLKAATRFEAWPHLGRLNQLGPTAVLPNGFGLHDTLGNMAEWCRDGPTDNVIARDGDGLRASARPNRWLRGGSLSTQPHALHTGYHPASPGQEDLDRDGDSDHHHEADTHSGRGNTGLRLARPLLR